MNSIASHGITTLGNKRNVSQFTTLLINTAESVNAPPMGSEFHASAKPKRDATRVVKMM
jgi:hypothetical protein